MKFCLLVTVALDIFIKEKNNNTLYFPWISPLSFFYANGVYLVKLSREVPYYPFFDPHSQIFQHPSPPLIIFHTNFQPPCLLEPSLIWNLRVHNLVLFRII